MLGLVVITGYQPGGGCCTNNFSGPCSLKEWGLHWLNYLQVTDRASQYMTSGLLSKHTEI